MHAVRAVRPIPRGHQRDLPFAVRDLSRMLTTERGTLHKPYWAAPRFLSAYMHFFMPWNVFRLSCLLPGLPLHLEPDDLILDLGSGPLTLPLALWCSLPALREIPLHFVCTDVTTRPMEVGLGVFRHLAGEQSPWRFTLQKAPVRQAIAGLERPAACIMAGNVLNELQAPKQGTLEDATTSLMGFATRKLIPGGTMLLVEPGTRLGGKMVTLARQGLLEAGVAPLAPCTHAEACPMQPGREREGYGPTYTGWCHFTLPAEAAPRLLHTLGERAGIERESLALSFFLGEKVGRGLAQGKDTETLDELEALYQELQEEDQMQPEQLAPSAQPARAKGLRGAATWPTVEPGTPFPLRVVSAPIRLPDEQYPGRYSCGEYGLTLLLDARWYHSGAVVEAVPLPFAPGERPQRDRKSGALLAKPTNPFVSKRDPRVVEDDEDDEQPYSAPAKVPYGKAPHGKAPYGKAHAGNRATQEEFPRSDKGRPAYKPKGRPEDGAVPRSHSGKDARKQGEDAPVERTPTGKKHWEHRGNEQRQHEGRPRGPKPYEPRQDEGRPRGPRQDEPKQHEGRPRGPKPYEPRQDEGRARGPKQDEGKQREHKQHEGKQREPRQHDDGQHQPRQRTFKPAEGSSNKGNSRK